MKRVLELDKAKCSLATALKALEQMGEDRMIGFLDEFVTITSVLEEKLFSVTEEEYRERHYLNRSAARRIRVISILNHFFCGETSKYETMSALSELRVPAVVQQLLVAHTFSPTCPFPINHLYLGVGHAAYLHVNENIITWDTTDKLRDEDEDWLKLHRNTTDSLSYTNRYMDRFTPRLTEKEFATRMSAKKLDIITGLLKHKTCGCEVQTAYGMVPGSANNIMELVRARCVGIHCRVSFRYHPKYNFRPGNISFPFFFFPPPNSIRYYPLSCEPHFRR